MKSEKKFLTCILLAVLLTAFFAVASFAADGQDSASTDEPITSFSVDLNGNSATSTDLGVTKWYKSSDGNYYIFANGKTDRTNLKVYFDSTDSVSVSGKELKSGQATDVFSEGDNFVLTSGGKSYNLVFIEMSDYPAIFINTQSGTLDNVYADKEYKEPGNIEVIDSDGKDLYNGALDYIKGRGNETWGHDKKPFNIKLAKKANLFKMGKSKKWCLLANATDNTLLRNKIGYEMGTKIGLDTTSDVVQLNLYVNGEYLGAYTITEKVEIGDNRVEIRDLEGDTENLNADALETYSRGGSVNSIAPNSYKYVNIPTDPDDITGGYLLELDYLDRYRAEVSGFVTDKGQGVVIKSPEYASKAQVEYIRNYFNEAYEALYSPTGYNSKGKYYTDYFDIDSLARIYIIHEFTKTVDVCSSSFYIYKDVGGKFCFGPLWDLDHSLKYWNSNQSKRGVDMDPADPTGFYAANSNMVLNAETVTPEDYYKSFEAQALNHLDFCAKVKEIWQNDFSPNYSGIASDFAEYADDCTSIAVANALRWNVFSTSDRTAAAASYKKETDAVADFMNSRFNFLNDAFSSDRYEIRYDVKGMNKIAVDSNVYSSRDKATLKNVDSDYILLGWTTDPEGTTAMYAPGDQYTVTGDTVFYAVYGEKKKLHVRLFEKISAFFSKIYKFFKNLFSIKK